jgi:phosphoglycolate phosphatase-like HAD superfamily hydrolase
MNEFRPHHSLLTAIDSDGCVFDTMELKHKECFIPEFIRYYDLQAVSRLARETWEFVNLYSRTRGVNRFAGLIATLDLLALRPEVRERGLSIQSPPTLKQWLAEDSQPSNPRLQSRMHERGDDPELRRCLAWSEAVNASIAGLVRNVPPFPYVRDCLERLHAAADLIVCSATPTVALKQEWEENRIAHFVQEIYGQEHGSKKQILQLASHYEPQRALMIGDAPGDQAAAQARGCLFFPIRPGAESESWRELAEQGIDRFLAGTFAGEYQTRLIAEFEAILPEHPPFTIRS